MNKFIAAPTEDMDVRTELGKSITLLSNTSYSCTENSMGDIIVETPEQEFVIISKKMVEQYFDKQITF